MTRLFLLFIAVPAVEILLLLRVGRLIGFWSTFFFMVATAIVGAWLARSQGFRVLSAIQVELKAGRVPGRPLLEGVLILLAAAVLLTPGFLTDAVGFGLLVPPIRQSLADKLLRAVQSGKIDFYRWQNRGSRGKPWQQQGEQVSGEVKGNWRVDSEET